MDNIENVKGAFDSFVNDKYTDAENKIKTFFDTKKNEYLKDRLGLEDDVVGQEDESEDNEEEDGD